MGSRVKIVLSECYSLRRLYRKVQIFEGHRFDCRRQNLMNAIVQAAEYGAHRKLDSLGNFINGWDFVRFAFLFDKLSKDPDLPNLHKIKEAIMACRSIRNEFAHPNYNPQDQGLNDAKFAFVLDRTRDCLPKVNGLTGDKLDEIYDKVEVLESILYLRSRRDEADSDVWTSV